MIDLPPPSRSQPNGHPADGLTMRVPVADDASMCILDPRSFADGGMIWRMTHGSAEAIKLTAGSMLLDYDYLLSGHISMREAVRRLRIMRAYRKAAVIAANKATE